MKNLNKWLAIALVALSLCLACENYRPAHVAVVPDRSGSVEKVRESIVGLAEASLVLPGIKKGSHLEILSTGDAGTAMEPISIASLGFPCIRKVMEGRDMAAKDEAFLKDVETLLAKIPPPSSRTPLYIAVRRATETLRGLGCDPKPVNAQPPCYLFVISDGEENVEKLITRAIRGSSEAKFPEEMLIDNSNIEVHFCGLSDTNDDSPAHDSRRIARMENTWRSLFRHPEMVSFQPFCPKKEVGKNDDH